MWRVAVVHHGQPSNPAVSHLRRSLNRHGLVEGVHCVVEAAGAAGQWHRLPRLVEQLLHRGPDVLVAIGALAALSAQQATARAPILHAIVLDPSEIGLTAPNVSGITTFDPDQATHHVQLLGQLMPQLHHLALLTDTDAPRAADGLNPLLSRFRQAATARRLEITCATVSNTDADLGRSFDLVRRSHAEALVALEVPAVTARLEEIVRMAERERLPTLSPYGGPEASVVMQGAALLDAIDPLAERIAATVRGTSGTDEPLRSVRHERLVVHRGRARRIGLIVPECVLDRVTEFIDDRPGNDLRLHADSRL